MFLSTTNLNSMFTRIMCMHCHPGLSTHSSSDTRTHTHKYAHTHSHTFTVKPRQRHAHTPSMALFACQPTKCEFFKQLVKDRPGSLCVRVCRCVCECVQACVCKCMCEWVSVHSCLLSEVSLNPSNTYVLSLSLSLSHFHTKLVIHSGVFSQRLNVIQVWFCT